MPFVSLVFVLMSLFVVPASAEALNYRDYEVSVTVDGNNDIVTLGFPYEQWIDWVLRPFSGGSEIATGQGDYFQGEFPWMDNYDKFYLMIAPFGGATFSNVVSPYDGFYLSTDNIPSDAKWSAGLVILADDEANTMSSIHFTSRSWVVDGSTASIFEYGSSTSLTQLENYHYDVTFSGDVCTDSGGWFPQFLFHFSADSSIFWCALTSFEVTMSINSYYRVLDEMGYDDQIDELRQELEQQNIKLDSVINGTPEQNESANNAAGVLGDKGEQLGNLAGAIQPDKPNLDSVNTNVSDLVPSTGLNSLTSAISPIANNELVIKILVMVATLILVSYVLFGKRG